MAKIYTPFTWLNEILSGSERFDIKQDDGTPIESNVRIDLITTVTQAGTPVNATRMNQIETGLDALDTKVAAMEVHGTVEKTSIVDADELSMADSAASYAQKRVTFANLKTSISSALAWLAQVTAAASKATPESTDLLSIVDVTAGNVIKKVTLGSLSTLLSASLQAISNKDASNGYAGLTGYLVNIKNAAGTITSFIQSVATVARTYTLPDHDAVLGNWQNNFSTAAQVLTAATRTYIDGTKIAIPASGLQVGTVITWVIDVTKTAAGIAASTFDIAFGTNGTVSDTARVSFTKPAGTAVADNGRIVIECVIRGPISGSGVAVGHFQMTHNLSATGHLAIAACNVVTVSAAFDMTTPVFVGVCATTGAADAITVQMATAEAKNL